MLITVYSSKHHLILMWVFLLNYIRSFLKNRMQHLAEAAPVDRTQNHNFETVIGNILIDDSGNISISKRKGKKAIGKAHVLVITPVTDWIKRGLKVTWIIQVEKKNCKRIYSPRCAPLLYLLRNTVNQP